LLNPFAPETVNVDVADCPALTEAGVNGVAETEKSGGFKKLNVAVMVSSALRATVQVPIPEHPPPLQPPKLDPEAAAAVRVTEVPTGNNPKQFVLEVTGTSQSIPAGLLITLPLPPPIITRS
jgi:hypothetical protein